MNIKIKNTPEQVALVKAMASHDRNVALEAQAAVATLMGPVLNEIINNAISIGNLYETKSFDWDDNPSLPLDLFHDITDEDYIEVHSVQSAGGLPYSQVFPAHNELKFSLYSLDAALAFDRKYAAKSRLDVVSKTFTRMAQEVQLKQEKTAFNVLARALIAADTKFSSAAAAAGNHAIGSTTENVFQLDDLNRWITRTKRINASFSTGTPTTGSKVGVTDILVSPEMVEQLRSMSYNPVNVRAFPNTDESTAMPAPESLREKLYSAAGLPSFYGINVIEILELGVGMRFNAIFGALDTGNDIVGGGNTGTFDNTADELLLGIDRARGGLIRPTQRDEWSNSDFSVEVDSQFSNRQRKIGFYGSIQEGRVVVEDRALSACIV